MELLGRNEGSGLVRGKRRKGEEGEREKTNLQRIEVVNSGSTQKIRDGQPLPIVSNGHANHRRSLDDLRSSPSDNLINLHIFFSSSSRNLSVLPSSNDDSTSSAGLLEDSKNLDLRRVSLVLVEFLVVVLVEGRKVDDDNVSSQEGSEDEFGGVGREGDGGRTGSGEGERKGRAGGDEGRGEGADSMGSYGALEKSKQGGGESASKISKREETEESATTHVRQSLKSKQLRLSQITDRQPLPIRTNSTADHPRRRLLQLHLHDLLPPTHRSLPHTRLLPSNSPNSQPSLPSTNNQPRLLTLTNTNRPRIHSIQPTHLPVVRLSQDRRRRRTRSAGGKGSERVGQAIVPRSRC